MYAQLCIHISITKSAYNYEESLYDITSSSSRSPDYTDKPVCGMKPTVISSSSLFPYRFWWIDVPSVSSSYGHITFITSRSCKNLVGLGLTIPSHCYG